jgi:hypothetical protein
VKMSARFATCEVCQSCKVCGKDNRMSTYFQTLLRLQHLCQSLTSLNTQSVS